MQRQDGGRISIKSRLVRLVVQFFSAEAETAVDRCRECRSALPAGASEPGPDPFQAPVNRRPSLDQIGHVGANAVGPEPGWLKRHVETVVLQSLTSAHRQLTVDVVLPADDACSFPWRDGERLFYLPIALMLKRPPASNIDMRDEGNQSLPVLNRIENAEISYVALIDVMTAALGASLAQEAAPFVKEAVFAVDEDVAKTNVLFAITRMIAREPTIQRNPNWEWLVELLALLSVHSLSWLGLAGLPGERRVIKFAYDIRTETPKPIPRRPRRVVRRVRAEGAAGLYEVYYEDWDLGDGYPHGFIVRMVKRLVTIIGGSAYHIPIETPYIRNTPSYHLQVKAPEGLETRRVDLLAKLVDKHGSVVSPVDATTPDCAHLYFSQARVQQMGKAIVSLRVGRRGLLSYSFVACIAIATMLWEFASHNSAIASGSADSRAAAVAVLLLVPTLMLLFAIRPGEHSLATQLLSGVRALLAVEALLCVTVAGVLVGVRPFHQDLPSLWHFAADVATVLGMVVGSCWVLSFMMLEAVRAVVRQLFANYWIFTGAALVLAAVAYGWLIQTTRSAALADLGDYIDWIVLGAIGAVSMWVASFNSAASHRENARLVGYSLLLTGAACLFAAGSRARLWQTAISWPTVRGLVTIAVPGGALVIVLLAIAHAFGRPRRELSVRDEGTFFVGPGGLAAPRGSSDATSPLST